MISELVLYELDTGHQEVAYRSDSLIEAPNWSPCGSFLVVNGGGRIWRLDLGGHDLKEITTAPHLCNNNDHGISPDGSTLVLSGGPEPLTSAIFTCPISGGTPRQVTPNRPSYWHGWSPDGETLAYTACRGGIFNIFTIPLVGGHERQITFGPGHKDGPDYTSCGTWIWFNSDHHDRGADLWRVTPDGEHLEQMTADERVNWFPHPAPAAGVVLYLAYPEGTEGHPFGRDVELRLISENGGACETLTRFWGGQGSINVPCWAPDGTRFAYMRYVQP